ncbi:MAG: LamG-like jellyroll fold domain-containing protein [Candidatus Eisenbacteria bacterium]
MALALDETTGFTVEAWINYTDTAGDETDPATILAKAELAGYWNYRLAIDRNDPGRVWFGMKGYTQEVQVYCTSDNLNDGQWHHIAGWSTALVRRSESSSTESGSIRAGTRRPERQPDGRRLPDRQRSRTH